MEEFNAKYRLYVGARLKKMLIRGLAFIYLYNYSINSGQLVLNAIVVL